MRRAFLASGILLLIQLFALPALAQDKLAGRWEGTIQSMQGERPTVAIFKKEGDVYTGKTQGLRPGSDIQLSNLKVEGNKITAKADVETPQATVTINYTFTLNGETMTGQGSLDFGGQAITFDLKLKRVSTDTSGPLTPSAGAPTNAPPAGGQGAGQGGGQQRQRGDVQQPQQKQSIDYFVGAWSYRYVGRESALWPAPRECTVNFVKRADGKSVEGTVACKHEGGSFNDTLVITFDEATKMVTFSEKLGSGTTLSSKGDWSSPISIRFTIDPVTVKGQKLQLRRTISIVAAHSFTVSEELSEDGGPFVRLGSAVFAKAK